MEKTHKEYLDELRIDARQKLDLVRLPEDREMAVCWSVADQLGLTGPTIKNYLKSDRIADGFTALAIYRAFRELGYCKPKRP